MSLHRTLRFLLIVAATTMVDSAGAAQLPPIDRCAMYGFAPGSRDYALCRMNLRHFWATGPCASSEFAWAYREYCHLNPPPFL